MKRLTLPTVLITPQPVCCRCYQGDTTGNIPVTIIDDTEIDEGIHEVFVVELTGPVNGEPYWIGSTNIRSTVIINDGICDRAQIVQDAIVAELTGRIRLATTLPRLT